MFNLNNRIANLEARIHRIATVLNSRTAGAEENGWVGGFLP